ncbi:MAG: hypothetical protein E7509_04725 [Ruminococcus sp.]|nr:hypothetical protein [Ruminococcus sp.]
MKRKKYLFLAFTVVISAFSVACSAKDVDSKEKTTTADSVTVVATTTKPLETTITVNHTTYGENTDVPESSTTVTESSSDVLTTTVTSTSNKKVTTISSKKTSKTTTTVKKTTTTSKKTTTKPTTTTKKVTTTVNLKQKLQGKHKVPIINVDTNGKNITSLKEYVDCTVDVFNVDSKYELNDVPGGIRVRGNSTAYYGDVQQILKNQVPYRIKFDSKTNMLGLNDGAKCKSWVLLKVEWNLVPNDIAFKMAQALFEGQDNFVSDSQFVHVYVNDKFKGLYLLCEQTQINKNRININEVDEGYTGTDIGYLVEIDNYAWSDPEDYCFNVTYADGPYITDIEGTRRPLVSSGYTIKNDIYSQKQVDYISKYTNNVFKIVYEACENGNYQTLDSNNNIVNSDFNNAKDAVNAVLDLESVVNMYILDEIVHDNDCGEGSFFMCVDFSATSTCKKLRFTAPWDYGWGYEGQAANKYYAAAFNDQSFVNQFGERSNPWYVLLMTEDWFVDMVKERWTELSKINALQNVIDAEYDLIDYYKKDFDFINDWTYYCGKDLIKWVNDRINWLDQVWLK